MRFVRNSWRAAHSAQVHARSPRDPRGRTSRAKRAVPARRTAHSARPHPRAPTPRPHESCRTCGPSAADRAFRTSPPPLPPPNVRAARLVQDVRSKRGRPHIPHEATPAPPAERASRTTRAGCAVPARRTARFARARGRVCAPRATRVVRNVRSQRGRPRVSHEPRAGQARKQYPAARSSSRPGCVGVQPSSSCDSALDAGTSTPKKLASQPKCS